MKIDRLLSLILLLLERKKISAPELAGICEVSVRTIYRDLEVLERAGIPIVTYPGLNGGVGIMDSYKLEKRLFTTADITTLLMSLGSIRTSLSGREVAAALAKVRGMIPEEKREEIEAKAGRITIDMTSWLGANEGKTKLETVQQALEGCFLLTFTYRDRHGNTSQRRIEPARLLFKDMLWYVQGYCLEREDFRLFKLNRMQDMTLLEEQFGPRPISPPAQRPFQPGNDIQVVLRLGEQALDRLVDIYGWQCLELQEPNQWLARIPIPPGERGLHFLMGFGPACECLEPETIRLQLLERFRQCLALYGQA